MSVTKQGNSKAWSLVSPQIAPPVTVPVIWPFILHAAILTHHKAARKVNCRFLAETSNLFQLSTKTERGKKQTKKRKHLLVKKQKWEERFTDILDWQNQGTGTMQTNFRLLKCFCYLLFTWMWCAALFLTQNYWQPKEMPQATWKKKIAVAHWSNPFPTLGRGEKVQVKKLNVTSHPCPHPRVLYRKNIQNIDRRQRFLKFSFSLSLIYR